MGLDLLGSTCDYLGFYSVRLPIFIIAPKWRLGFVLDVEALNGRKLCLENTCFLVNLNSVSAAVNNQYRVFQNQPECRGLIKKPF
ncbi:MAG: hypothetical protein Ct9H300mP27_02910 [Chloroflexota bacterium]|nr:MAG: hypothetical protein Ct9H300mP27_02910 [Chloroflexota bacterium]